MEAALEVELENHLDEKERAAGNRKNGTTSKRLKTADGTIDLDTPRDRSANFDPQIIKRETILAEGLESKIIRLYGHGMSLRDISAHIKEMYDTDISAATLSTITNKVIPLVKEWQNRPLEPLYYIVWLDAMHIRSERMAVLLTGACIISWGSMLKVAKTYWVYISESEGANFWLGVLSNL